MARSAAMREARMTPWINGGRTPDGKIKLVFEEPAFDPLADEQWKDMPCFLCGKFESWFRCIISYDMAFCPDCLPTGRNDLGLGLDHASDMIALGWLVRHLWKESHAVRLR